MATAMPTAAKASGALTFAIVGWLLANAFIPGMPDAASAGHLREGGVVVGLFVGWIVMGNSVGHKYIDSIGYGWKTAIVLAFFSLLFLGMYEMMKQSTRMVYDGPIDAILDIFARMFDRAKQAITVSVVMTMVIGGAISGFVTESVSRRWR